MKRPSGTRCVLVCLLALMTLLPGEALPTAAPAPASPAPSPTSEPSPTPESSPAPEPSPTLEPSPTPEPSLTPGPIPALEPIPTPEPSPVLEPSPTPEPSAAPTPSPTPAPSAPAQPAPTLPGVPAGTWLYGGPYRYYRSSRHRLTHGTASRLHILMAPGSDGSAPDPQDGWTPQGGNYTVTYGAAWTPEPDGDEALRTYTAVPLAESSAFCAEQRAAVERFLTCCYPYVSADAMRAAMVRAGWTEAAACGEDELIAGAQAALYQTLHPVIDLDGDGVPEAATDWAYESTDPAAGTAVRARMVQAAAGRAVNAVRDYLLALGAQAQADDLYALKSWQVQYSGTDAPCTAVISGMLDRPVRDAAFAGERDLVTLTFHDGNDPQGAPLAACTLQAGEQAFRCTVPDADPRSPLLLEGRYCVAGCPQVYYYEDGSGARPQLGVQYGCRHGAFQSSIAPRTQTAQVQFTLDWVVGSLTCPAYHSAENWQRFQAQAAELYGLALPDTMTLTLLADGVPVRRAGVENPCTAAGATGWNCTWDGLPLYDAAGRSITYTVAGAAPTDEFCTSLYRYPLADGADGGVCLYLMATDRYAPYIPRLPLLVEKRWGDGAAAHAGQAVTAALAADGVPTGDTLTLDAANGWQGAFAPLPLLRLQVNYGDLVLEPGGPVPAVIQRRIPYTVAERGMPPGYTAACTAFWRESPCTPSVFAGTVPLLVALETKGRRLALAADAAGVLRPVLAAPDTADPAQLWVLYRGHLYDLFVLENGALAGAEGIGSPLAGELYVDGDGVRFAAAADLAAPAALCWDGRHLCGQDDHWLAVDGRGALYASGSAAAAAPVTVYTLTPGLRLENDPLPTPTPSSSPLPSPTPSSTPGSAGRGGAATPAPPSPAPTPSDRGGLPATGDGTPLALWAALALAAAGALRQLCRRRR